MWIVKDLLKFFTVLHTVVKVEGLRVSDPISLGPNFALASKKMTDTDLKDNCESLSLGL